MVKAYRTTVSRPDPEREKASSGSGPVKTTKMSPEEMEDYFARIADRIPPQANQPKKGIEDTMKNSNFTKRRKPEKEAFLKSIAAGNTIAKTEETWGMSVNGLAYWVKKWDLVGITPGKARALLDGVAAEEPIKQPEDTELQNASFAEYEKKLAEWESMSQELQQVKLENGNLRHDLNVAQMMCEASDAEIKRWHNRCLELEGALKKWNGNDNETQELLLEITSERDQFQKQVAELQVLLAEMTEDRDNWWRTAEEAKQALAELQDESRSLSSELVMTNPEPNPHYDPVNHPDHYTAGGIETIDFIRAKLTPAEFVGYCKGNVIKYLARANYKGGFEDLRKAGKYIEFATKEA